MTSSKEGSLASKICPRFHQPVKSYPTESLSPRVMALDVTASTLLQQSKAFSLARSEPHPTCNETERGFDIGGPLDIDLNLNSRLLQMIVRNNRGQGQEKPEAEVKEESASRKRSFWQGFTTRQISTSLDLQTISKHRHASKNTKREIKDNLAKRLHQRKDHGEDEEFKQECKIDLTKRLKDETFGVHAIDRLDDIQTKNRRISKRKTSQNKNYSAKEEIASTEKQSPSPTEASRCDNISLQSHKDLIARTKANMRLDLVSFNESCNNTFSRASSLRSMRASRLDVTSISSTKLPLHSSKRIRKSFSLNKGLLQSILSKTGAQTKDVHMMKRSTPGVEDNSQSQNPLSEHHFGSLREEHLSLIEPSGIEPPCFRSDSTRNDERPYFGEDITVTSCQKHKVIDNTFKNVLLQTSSIVKDGYLRKSMFYQNRFIVMELNKRPKHDSNPPPETLEVPIEQQEPSHSLASNDKILPCSNSTAMTRNPFSNKQMDTPQQESDHENKLKLSFLAEERNFTPQTSSSNSDISLHYNFSSLMFRQKNEFENITKCHENHKHTKASGVMIREEDRLRTTGLAVNRRDGFELPSTQRALHCPSSTLHSSTLPGQANELAANVINEAKVEGYTGKVSTALQPYRGHLRVKCAENDLGSLGPTGIYYSQLTPDFQDSENNPFTPDTNAISHTPTTVSSIVTPEIVAHLNSAQELRETPKGHCVWITVPSTHDPDAKERRAVGPNQDTFTSTTTIKTHDKSYQSNDEKNSECVKRIEIEHPPENGQKAIRKKDVAGDLNQNDHVNDQLIIKASSLFNNELQTFPPASYTFGSNLNALDIGGANVGQEVNSKEHSPLSDADKISRGGDFISSSVQLFPVLQASHRTAKARDENFAHKCEKVFPPFLMYANSTTGKHSLGRGGDEETLPFANRKQGDASTPEETAATAQSTRHKAKTETMSTSSAVKEGRAFSSAPATVCGGKREPQQAVSSIGLASTRVEVESVQTRCASRFSTPHPHGTLLRSFQSSPPPLTTSLLPMPTTEPKHFPKSDDYHSNHKVNADHDLYPVRSSVFVYRNENNTANKINDVTFSMGLDTTLNQALVGDKRAIGARVQNPFNNGGSVKTSPLRSSPNSAKELPSSTQVKKKTFLNRVPESKASATEDDVVADRCETNVCTPTARKFASADQTKTFANLVCFPGSGAVECAGAEGHVSIVGRYARDEQNNTRAIESAGCDLSPVDASKPIHAGISIATKEHGHGRAPRELHYDSWSVTANGQSGKVPTPRDRKALGHAVDGQCRANTSDVNEHSVHSSSLDISTPSSAKATEIGGRFRSIIKKKEATDITDYGILDNALADKAAFLSEKEQQFSKDVSVNDTSRFAKDGHRGVTRVTFSLATKELGEKTPGHTTPHYDQGESERLISTFPIAPLRVTLPLDKRHSFGKADYPSKSTPLLDDTDWDEMDGRGIEIIVSDENDARVSTVNSGKRAVLRRIWMILLDNRVAGRPDSERALRPHHEEYRVLKRVLNIVFITIGVALLISVFVVIIYTYVVDEDQLRADDTSRVTQKPTSIPVAQVEPTTSSITANSTIAPYKTGS
ncbi:uncharacterized protein LOC106065341 [Biomphalaria glabrata]|uniref:Uncharacterized protein LOC106065341 n=1 Tax=Biomphalaria glabrata TaxID=6526 RepID=A0A9W2ZA39_BIOGL|nr:uncharacterized protein LOC106065341 [Biomphalaria glabrata]